MLLIYTNVRPLGGENGLGLVQLEDSCEIQGSLEQNAVLRVWRWQRRSPARPGLAGVAEERRESMFRSC
jgi:hypothetical protein